VVVYFGFDFCGNITHKDFNGHGAVIFYGSLVKIAEEREKKSKWSSRKESVSWNGLNRYVLRISDVFR